MTKSEALALALSIAQENRWPEKGRVGVTSGRKYILFGPYLWWVSLLYMRANLWAQITIDDASGEVIDVLSRPHNPRRKPFEPDSAPSDENAGEGG